eukprot:TRINITY_DN9068_c0_g1_i1.p1 TRINITY_DN9068_c0_g1~~TRINITY_DN9068_c0_g1_i1.p1  ORF type:complete len:355 (-),score=22.69 TRINITY_DN9068_c0_g1_i1:13-1077(-)
MSLINEKDLNAVRCEYLFPLPEFTKKALASYIQSRDWPMLTLFFNISVTTFALSIVLLLTDGIPKWVAPVLFLTNLILYQERFILALHYSQHRPVTRGRWRWLNEIPHSVMCPFFGLPPMVYNLHHVIMHHREDNMAPWDLSSTEFYQRDNIAHFLVYAFRHLVFITFELTLYAFRRGYFGLTLQMVAMTTLYWGGIYYGMSVKPWPTFWLLVAPYTVGAFLLMFGNWSQHIFVDPDAPRDDYRLTFVCINSRLNNHAFNDGYHITHHIYPGIHWTELPKKFNSDRQAYKDHNAFVFDGLDFFQVGMYTMTKQWKKLASHLVDPLSGSVWDQETAVKELKRRVARVPKENQHLK